VAASRWRWSTFASQLLPARCAPCSSASAWLIAYLVAHRARGLRAPLFTAWLNQNTESRVRATLNSVVGQADAVGEVVGGPAIGAIGALSSLRWALGASAVLLAPALGLYAHALKRGGRERVA
jgi:DHA3 family tetracycline resistance protein-like MFS transporter